MRTRNLIGLLIITILVLVGCFFPGCHDTDSRFSSQPAGSAGQPATTVSPAADTNSRRTALITALQNLRKVIASGDKRQIAGLFHFPIPDSVMPITVDDSAALVEIDNSHHLTEAQFDKFFMSTPNMYTKKETRKITMDMNSAVYGAFRSMAGDYRSCTMSR